MERISVDEYKSAVEQMVDIAMQDTSGSRVAAQVLLSAYNGDAFQLNVADLCVLDIENYRQALLVIRGRFETSTEPHELIPNGSKIFRGLWDQWKNLHISRRGLPKCPVCEGRGRVYANPDEERDMEMITCKRCNGEGRVCSCPGHNAIEVR